MNLRKSIAAIILAVACAVCMCLPFTACKPVKPDHSFNEDEFLVADGGLIKNAKGEQVMLRGVNAGGLFVTEHWMTGFKYGSSASNDFKSLTETLLSRFGAEQTLNLWDEYRANWWTEADFKNCADMGFNVIRLPFTYMNVDFGAISDYENAGIDYDFTALDDFINTAERYGMYTILDLHGAYGSQNGQDHSGQIFNSVSEVDFYSNEKMMGLTAKLWGKLADHYKDNPAVAGYDILNEPGEKGGTTTTRHWDFYDMAYKAIRATGDNHVVIFESCWDAQNLPRPEKYGWKNCMYSFHHYAGDKLTEEGFNSNWKAKLQSITSQNFGVPLFMGEFTCYSNAHNWEYVLGLLNDTGWHWTSWTYKVWGRMPWGIVNIIADNTDKVNVSEDSYEDILQKFKKLGTENANAEYYTFYTVNGEEEREEYKTLADIFKEYCTAPPTEEN